MTKVVPSSSAILAPGWSDPIPGIKAAAPPALQASTLQSELL